MAEQGIVRSNPVSAKKKNGDALRPVMVIYLLIPLRDRQDTPRVRSRHRGEGSRRHICGIKDSLLGARGQARVARGEIRGGRFVAGFTGEQFAKPEALELPRAMKRNKDTAPPVEVPAADPLNLTGFIRPGARVSPLANAIPVWQPKPKPRRLPWERADSIS